MRSIVWELALMVTLGVVIALAFTALWLQDKDRADEVAADPERVDPEGADTDSAPGTARSGGSPLSARPRPGTARGAEPAG
jgi:hypothetical protein